MPADPRDPNVNPRDTLIQRIVWAVVLVLVVGLGYAQGQRLYAGRTLFDITYGFGPVIESLVRQGRYGAYDDGYSFWAVAYRLPFIPLLLTGIYTFVKPVVGVIVVKNLLLWSAWLWAALRLRDIYDIAWRAFLLLLSSAFLLPLNMSAAFELEIEEAYLFQLIGLVYVVLVTRDRKADSHWILGLALAAIYLTKSSAFLLCGGVVLWVLFSDWRGKQLGPMSAVPLVAVTIAALAWGGFVRSQTGYFAFGTNLSSWNGINLRKANNVHADGRYPVITLDSLDADHLLHLEGQRDEWEMNRNQADLGWQYIRQAPPGFWSMLRKKLAVLLYYPRNAPESLNATTAKLATFSIVINHFALWVFLGVCLRQAWKRSLTRENTLALFIGTLYLLPFLVGFLYQRHLVPLYGIVFLALLLQFAGRSPGKQLAIDR